MIAEINIKQGMAGENIQVNENSSINLKTYNISIFLEVLFIYTTLRKAMTIYTSNKILIYKIKESMMCDNC